jgi:hypothetical protein
MTKKVKPLSPSEVRKDKRTSIPDAIIQAVNELLAEKFRKGSVNIKQKDIVERAMKIDEKITKKMIDDNHWLDFEPAFEKEGWTVSYDKPGWDENYDSSFTFKPAE